MREITYAQAINEALHEEMARDETVFILGEDVCQDLWGTHTGLAERFGIERIRETSISEKAIVGCAVGAAISGYRPIADIMYADFFFCAADEVLNYTATHRFQSGGLTKVSMVVKAAIGGGGGGGAMHSQCPEAFLWHRPGLKIALPSTPYDAKGLLKTAIRDNNAVIYLFHKNLLGIMGKVPKKEYTIPFGVADIKKEGTDVTIIAISNMVLMSLRVADKFEEIGISAEVIDPRTLEPLDMDTIIKSVRKTKRAIIVDEDITRCGVTSEIAVQIMERAFKSLETPIQRVAALNYPIPCGCLEKIVLPQYQSIVNAIRKVMSIEEPLTINIGDKKNGFVIG